VEIGIARLAGLVWLGSFGLSAAGTGFKILPLQLAGNAVYFVVAFAIYRYLAQSDPFLALVILPLAAIGCVMQSIGMIQGDRDLQRLALMPFGLFLGTIGVLLLRAGVAPQLLDYALMAAGLGSFLFLIPGTPGLVTAFALGLAIISEFPLVIWLLVKG
jgi:hypothetical protein